MYQPMIIPRGDEAANIVIRAIKSDLEAFAFIRLIPYIAFKRYIHNITLHTNVRASAHL